MQDRSRSSAHGFDISKKLRALGSHRVPSNPSKTTDQVDYFFPGLEQNDINPDSILQPCSATTPSLVRA
jgi:hypothetical protein